MHAKKSYSFLGIAQAILSNLEPWQEYDVKNILQHGKKINVNIITFVYMIKTYLPL